MVNEFDVGDVVKTTATFLDDSGVAADPTTVTFMVKSPLGAISSATYGSGTTIGKIGIGTYTSSFVISTEGLWYYRWAGSGAVAAAEEARVFARESAFS